MQSGIYSITKRDLYDLFSRLAVDNRVFVPYKYKDNLHFGEFSPEKEESIELGAIRQNQPFKSFLNPARERVLGKEKSDGRPIVVAGVKACDLSSLVLQDYVFLQGDYTDPSYAFNRSNTLIISNDCTFAKETCFCIAMVGRPYPTKYFDMNLSSLGESFLVEVATDKARAIVDKYKMFFKEAKNREMAERDAARDDVSGQVKGFINSRGTPDTASVNGTVKKHYDNLVMWQDHASTCVECGACNLVCPTCHCFLLFDEKRETETARGRVWDACLYKTFARVAGNHNPRKHLYERLRNRFDKKFAFFPDVLNYFACTGCGRCILACPGDIDIREVLKGLVKGEWKKPPHD